jgi:D-threo-aldose 1-dehydrogenase
VSGTATAELPRGRFGSEGPEVARLGLGTYCLVSERGVAHEDALAVVRAALEVGIDLFDTAPLYGAGEAEQILGEALAHAGATPFVIDKVGRFEASIVRRRKDEAYRNRELIRAQFMHSLRLLGLERVDALLIHESDAAEWWDDLAAADGPVVEELERLREEGLADRIGLSVRDPQAAAALARTGRFETMLYVHYYNVVWQEAGDAALAEAERRGMGVCIGAPYRRGLLLDAGENVLSGLRARRAPDIPPGAIERLRRARQLADAAGVTLGQLGLRFLLSDARVHNVLVGAETPAQVEENARWAAAGPLPEDVLTEVRALREVPLGGWD